MFINKNSILLLTSIFLCTILLLITLYLLYRYRKQSIDFYRNNQLKQDNSNLIEIKQRNIPLTNQIRSNSIETTPTIIEELMRKSLDLAKTAEKVADEKEKRISLKKDKTQIDL